MVENLEPLMVNENPKAVRLTVWQARARYQALVFQAVI